MTNYVVIFATMIVATLMTLGSVLLGAWIATRGVKVFGGGNASTDEEKGAFTIETPDDMALFPDTGESDKAEAQVIEKTKKFLQAFEG